ncbi:hypothetical protein ABBQ38_005425 [Trebouxia sp. C0009 RCD-2024]
MQKCSYWPALITSPATSRVVVTLFVCCLFGLQEAAAVESDRCMACSAVSSELSSRLLREKPRNHLDMRHRLDSEGKRYGKTIDYKFSELRILEILDGICDTVSEYELAGVHTDHTAGSQSTWQWLPPKSKRLSNSTRLGKPQLKQQQRRLQNDCARLIDKAEDDLTTALQKGSSSSGSLDDIHVTSPSCLNGLT